jgi:hypothetical protein
MQSVCAHQNGTVADVTHNFSIQCICAMLSQLSSAAVLGVDALQIDVETNLDSGLPSFIVVGLPDSAIKESRERVLTALKNSGYAAPPKKSRSIWRLLMCARKAQRLTCQSQLASWRAWAS